MPPVNLHKKYISETSSRAECIQKSIIQYAAHCISLLGELITSNVPLQDLMQTQSFTQLDFVPTVTEKILPEGSQRLAEKNHFRFLTKGYLLKEPCRGGSAGSEERRHLMGERKAKVCESSTIGGVSLHQQGTEKPQNATGSLTWSQTNSVWKTNVRASFQPERFPTSRSNSAPAPACHWDHVNMLLHLDSVCVCMCGGGGVAALIPFEARLPLLSQAC